jgi:hypothetical protein
MRLDRKKGEIKMKVYILLWESQFDSGCCDQEVYVFDSLEKAKERMRTCAECIIDCWEKDFDGDIETNETEMSFEIYESGEYCYNHETLSIHEKEVC